MLYDSTRLRRSCVQRELEELYHTKWNVKENISYLLSQQEISFNWIELNREQRRIADRRSRVRLFHPSICRPSRIHHRLVSTISETIHSRIKIDCQIMLFASFSFLICTAMITQKITSLSLQHFMAVCSIYTRDGRKSIEIRSFVSSSSAAASCNWSHSMSLVVCAP